MSIGLSFEMWKVRLREDCESQDKLATYSYFTEECLRILWEAETEPTVQGIIDGGKKVA